MRSLACTSTRLHANACLRERRACDTPTTQGAWRSVPPLLSMDMKRGNASSQLSGLGQEPGTGIWLGRYLNRIPDS